MTDKEFKLILDEKDEEWGRFAREAWDAWTKEERAEATIEDLVSDVEDTFIAVAEQRIIDIAENKIFVAVLDDNYYVEHGEFPAAYNGKNIKKEYVFETPEEFIKKWYELDEGAWYWVFDKGELFCSGAMDPGDIEIFEEYFEMTFDSPEEELDDDLDLPESVTISVDDLDLDLDETYEDEEELAEIVGDYLSDYLSDTYGFCHYSFDVDIVFNELNEPSEVVVTNIKWDVDELEDIDRLIDDARERSSLMENDDKNKDIEIDL